MGGINIDMVIEKMIQDACELWHEMTGGEVVFILHGRPKSLDIFERMEIANLTGVTFRG